MGTRLRRKLKEIHIELMSRRHVPVSELREWLRAFVQGYFNYHAVPGNSDALNTFRTAVCRSWRHALRRRSQKGQIEWKRFNRYVARWLPSVRILHPLPYMRWALAPR
jgi:RNA-directed DNA polymerase